MGTISAGGDKPRIESEEQIRFAVVMYGGVSLAIYINGVAQELLSMVRATAPQTPDGDTALVADKDLQGAMAVYRRLGRHLMTWHDFRARAPRMSAAQKSEALARLHSMLLEGGADDAPVRSRFVVDILSGTSAGGINSIFLAKSLTNQQSMEGVKRLWISEGDIATLINDDVSVAGISGLKLQSPPQSLLNSQRMYRKLLEAFDQMDTGRAPQASPLVDELDLFITTTDLEGLPLPVALTDNVIYERRHRNVFHFRYAGGGSENDFIKANDPFLAYAARCTSSFPFAFQPMCLADIEAVTRTYGEGSHPYRLTAADHAGWQKFYSEYWRASVADFGAAERGQQGIDPVTLAQREAGLKSDYLQRAFGDGGYLDNKPFSYATSMVMRRRADVPVRRKLLYIEPVTTHPESELVENKRPNFAENVGTALALPAREMIREDIERVLERNRLIARIGAYTRDVDADVASMSSAELGEDPGRGASLSALVDRYGVAYGAYHRLRVDEASSLLADLILRAAQLDPRSGAALAVRALVTAWRSSCYEPNLYDEGTVKRSESQFLEEFDLQFKLRRLTFISRRINELALLDEKAESLLAAWMQRSHHIRSLPEAFKETMRSEAWRAEFRAELRELKKLMSEDRSRLRAAQEGLARLKGEGTPLSGAVRDLGLSWQELEEKILSQGTAARAAAAMEMVEARQSSFNRLAERIRSDFQVPLRFGELTRERRAEGGGVMARDCLAFYYSQYHLYDMVLFPVQYGTGSAETSEIEIYRISPEDATGIIDERRDAQGRRKLAGTALFNFGAFLEQKWRRNDMLWGRLDGADRLICAVMPATTEEELEVRGQVVRQAQAAILAEDLYLEDVQNMSRALATCLAERLPAKGDEHSRQAALETFLAREGRSLPNALQSALQACLKDREALWQYYHDSYQVDRRVDPEQSVRSMARVTRVTAQMLEAVAADYRIKKSPFTWLAILAKMFWGLVEISVPQSLFNLLGRHWFKLLYLVDIGMIAGGMLMAQPAISKFGWMALAATVGIHALAAITGFYISGLLQGRLFAFIKWLLALALAALLAGGGLYYYEKFQAWRAPPVFISDSPDE